MLIQNGKRNTPRLSPRLRAIQKLLTALDAATAAGVLAVTARCSPAAQIEPVAEG